MYLIDRGWKPQEIDELSLGDAKAIFEGLATGLYGPMANQSVSMNLIHYAHAQTFANNKPSQRPKPPTYPQVEPNVWAHFQEAFPQKEPEQWKRNIIAQFKRRQKDVSDV